MPIGLFWTYPLKKTLPKAIVHKNAVLVQGITSPEIAGSWGVPEIGTVGLRKGLRLFALSWGGKSESRECDRMLDFLSLQADPICLFLCNYTHPVPGYCFNTHDKQIPALKKAMWAFLEGFRCVFLQKRKAEGFLKREVWDGQNQIQGEVLIYKDVLFILKGCFVLVAVSIVP